MLRNSRRAVRHPADDTPRALRADNGHAEAQQRMDDIAYTLCVATGTQDVAVSDRRMPPVARRPHTRGGSPSRSCLARHGPVHLVLMTNLVSIADARAPAEAARVHEVRRAQNPRHDRWMEGARGQAFVLTSCGSHRTTRPSRRLPPWQ
ncbi:DUF5133 domain-containing protein [Streptomyces clavifer]|uniref:DUF5133 domain-containing protein n=1 Tax=Streptomyces clavifer TaxID=68188 RepID=UPI00379A963B